MLNDRDMSVPAASFMEPCGLGVYLHVPFCLGKCGYCGFYSVVPNDETIEAWLKRLEEETAEVLLNETACKVKTVFVGGGNPTSVGAKNLERALNILQNRLKNANIVEWTIETNPETLTDATAIVLEKLPKLRLSVGIQRLRDEELRILGRACRCAIGFSAVARALSLTPNVSIDLILGIPDCPSIAPALARFVEKFPIQHVSAYLLSVENETALAEKVRTGVFPDPCETGPEELFEVSAVLKTYGFEQYEISNFAKLNYRCLHNMNYWLGGEYIGLGPAAVGTLDGIRKANIPDLFSWLAEKPAIVERLSPLDSFRETVMLRLRLVGDGLDLAWLERKYKKLPPSFGKVLESQIAAENIVKNGSVIKLSQQGIVFANRVIAELF